MKTIIVVPQVAHMHASTCTLVQTLMQLNDWPCVHHQDDNNPYDGACKVAATSEADRWVWIHPRLETTVAAVHALLDAFDAMGTADVVAAVCCPPSAILYRRWVPSFHPTDPDYGRICIGGDASGILSCADLRLDFAVSRPIAISSPSPRLVSDPDRFPGGLYLETRLEAGLWCEFPVYPHHLARP